MGSDDELLHADSDWSDDVMSRRPTFEQVQMRRRAREARSAAREIGMPVPTNALMRVLAGLPDDRATVRESAGAPTRSPEPPAFMPPGALEWMQPGEVRRGYWLPTPERSEESRSPWFLPTYIG